MRSTSRRAVSSSRLVMLASPDPAGGNLRRAQCIMCFVGVWYCMVRYFGMTRCGVAWGPSLTTTDANVCLTHGCGSAFAPQHKEARPSFVNNMLSIVKSTWYGTCFVDNVC